MKKLFFVLAVSTLMIIANGCGARRGLFGRRMQSVARPAYQQYAPQQYAPACVPTCVPSCVPSCNAAVSSGNAVTYGMPAGATFTESASVETVPADY